jgi:carbamoyl-phosphate synthase large subunit
VKESCFPFVRFPGADIILGPEMRSTGEVMGADESFEIAFAKSQLAVKTVLPMKGKVFMSFADRDKQAGALLAAQFRELGFEILSTAGSAKVMGERGVPVTLVMKVQEGRPNIIDYMKNEEVSLIVNTPSGPTARDDERKIRREAVQRGVACVTTMAAARVVVKAIKALQHGEMNVCALQDWYARR